ncbi:MAG: hypothetical protein WD005_02555, partial [Haliea sp.]
MRQGVGASPQERFLSPPGHPADPARCLFPLDGVHCSLQCLAFGAPITNQCAQQYYRPIAIEIKGLSTALTG